MKLWRNLSLGYKLSIAISVTLLFILGFSFTTLSQYLQNQLWQRETQTAENLNALAASLLEDSMMAGEKSEIQAAIDTLGNSVEGRILSIAVYDDQSILTAYASGFSRGREIPRKNFELQTSQPGCWECHQFPMGERPTRITMTMNGVQVIRNVVPLYNSSRCQSCHGSGQAVLGNSIVDLELSQYRTTLNTMTVGVGLGLTLAVILVSTIMYSLLRRIIVNPLGDLVQVSEAIVEGDLERQVHVRSQDEVGTLGMAFNTMTSRLRELIANLERRVEERTQDLQLRSAYLEASAEVGQRANTVLEPAALVNEIVHLIQDRFNLYYVGLFLADEKKEWAVLQAGTGEAGKAMLARNHRLRIGEGMIGWTVANSQARIALDVGKDAIRFDNPYLPETRSEAALPLRCRGEVIGALSVQSKEPAAFNQDTITVFQTMADQIATAIENANLFMESQDALEAERKAYGELSRQGWQELLRTRPEIASLSSSLVSVDVAARDWTPEMLESSKKATIIGKGRKTLAIPIILRDRVLGVVRLQKNEEAGDWSESDIQLVDTLVDQLETALESARLYTDSQRQAARERLVTEITTKLRGTTDPQIMLNTAVTELQRALKAQRAQVLLKTNPD